MDALDLDTPALYVDLDVLERNIAGCRSNVEPGASSSALT